MTRNEFCDDVVAWEIVMLIVLPASVNDIVGSVYTGMGGKCRMFPISGPSIALGFSEYAPAIWTWAGRPFFNVVSGLHLIDFCFCHFGWSTPYNRCVFLLPYALKLIQSRSVPGSIKIGTWRPFRNNTKVSFQGWFIKKRIGSEISFVPG